VSVLDSLKQAEAALVAAEKEMTERQKFETGWRITDALRNVRESIFTVNHPMPEHFYEGTDL
jgi:hypothetical protein